MTAVCDEDALSCVRTGGFILHTLLLNRIKGWNTQILLQEGGNLCQALHVNSLKQLPSDRLCTACGTYEYVVGRCAGEIGKPDAKLCRFITPPAGAILHAPSENSHSARSGMKVSSE